MIRPLLQPHTNAARALWVVALSAFSPALIGVPFFVPLMIGFLTDPLPSSSLTAAIGKAAFIAGLGSYLFGGPSAILAGLVLGFLTWRKGTVTFLESATVAVASGLACGVLWGIGIAVFVALIGLVSGLIVRWLATVVGILPAVSASAHARGTS